MIFISEMPKEAKDKILYAGLALFTNEGFKNTSVLDIVELARVSKTTFYQHFTSKEDLMANLLANVSDEIIAEVKREIDNEERIVYKAYVGIRRYMEICFTENRVANLLLIESVGVSQEVERVRNEAHRSFAQLMFQTVKGLLPNKVSEAEMRIVSQGMIGAINEVIVLNYNEKDGGLNQFEELARLLNRVVIAAFVTLAQ